MLTAANDIRINKLESFRLTKLGEGNEGKILANGPEGDSLASDAKWHVGHKTYKTHAIVHVGV